MSGSLKSHILGIDHVVQRLRALLEVIRRVSICIHIFEHKLCYEGERKYTCVTQIIGFL